jgi:hypothetical protein
MNYELETLLSLGGASFEHRNGYRVEFSIRQTKPTRYRPHGICYRLVLLRTRDRKVLVRFDNAHAPPARKGRFRKKPVAYDHWHAHSKDRGQPYLYRSALQLLEDFWSAVDAVIDSEEWNG